MAVRVTQADFEEKVLNNTLPVIVDFYSDSCVACKRLAPALGDLEDNFEGKLEVYKVNTNFDIELSEKYEVMSNPTILIFKSGEVVDTKVGALSYKDLENWVNRFV